MRVTEDKARQLLAEMGWPNAMIYSRKRLVEKLTAEAREPTPEVRKLVKDASLVRLLKTLTGSLAKGEPVELEPSRAEVKPEPPIEKVREELAAAGIDTSNAMKKVMKAVKARKKAKRPDPSGVIDNPWHKVKTAVFNVLVKASESAPVTKEQILKSVCRECPKADRVKAATVVSSVADWLEDEHPYVLHRAGKGYWVVPRPGSLTETIRRKRL